MSGKAALAAALAWLAVLPMGGVADDYPFYAPFGAVIAVSTSVASSLKASIWSVSAIFVGAVLAFTSAQLPLPKVVLLALVVAVGVMIGGWRRLRPAGEWIPASAVFVLIIGNAEGLDLDYAVAYLGLTALGALTGTLVNVAVPPLPLTRVGDAITSLREVLASQLDDLAGGLQHDDPPAMEEWEQRRLAVEPLARALRQVVADASEAQLGNWRAPRWHAVSDEQIGQAHGLLRLMLVLEDLTLIVVDYEHVELEQFALGRELRGLLAEAFEQLATALRDVDEEGSDGRLDDLEAAIQRFSDAVTRQQRDGAAEMFVAGALVVALRQLLASMPGPVPGRRA